MNILKQYVDLLKSLTAINPSVLILREEDKNIVRHLNMTRDIFYELIAPSDMFSFEGEYIGFISFNEFYVLYSAFDKPIVEQKDLDKIKIIDADTGESFVYKTYDRQYIKGTFKAIEAISADFVFTMSDKLRSGIKAKSNLICSDKVYIKSIKNEDSVMVSMINSKTGNQYSFKVSPKEVGDGHVEDRQGNRVDIDLVFPSTIIGKLPAGDYRVEVSSEGLISFFLKVDGIYLSIRATSIADADDIKTDM